MVTKWRQAGNLTPQNTVPKYIQDKWNPEKLKFSLQTQKILDIVIFWDMQMKMLSQTTNRIDPGQNAGGKAFL